MLGIPASRPRRLSLRILSVGVSALVLGGCGSGGSSSSSAVSADPPTTPACAQASLVTLGGVAARIYAETANGRIITQALRRVRRSRTLLAAIQRDDSRATRRVLRGLFDSQIVRARVTRGARVLADVGKRTAIAPASETLRDAAGGAIGSVTVSVVGVNGLAQTIRGFVDAEVLVLAGSHRLADTLRAGRTASAIPTKGHVQVHGLSYQVTSFAARAFNSAPLRVSLLLASSVLTPCSATRAETVADTIGRVGLRIYAGEHSGTRVAGVIRHVERSRAFRDAVLRDDPVATRAAIVGFFRTHLHVVRVRATLGSSLVTDLGGPFVLAPVGGVVRGAGGRVAGHFLLAVQDDMGYMLLAHGFTGAQVLMRVGSRQVMSTLWPGPASIPTHGPVSYGGVNYQAFSFVGEAFPTGSLRISLLVPAS